VSDHDCAGCWRYDAETDTETCLVCGAVRAPEVVPDGGEVHAFGTDDGQLWAAGRRDFQAALEHHYGIDGVRYYPDWYHEDRHQIVYEALIYSGDAEEVLIAHSLNILGHPESGAIGINLDELPPEAAVRSAVGEADDGSELVTDGGQDTCGRCGGTGEITKVVAGREGMVPCPDCDTVPQYAIPDELPENPAARIEAIESQLTILQRQRESWQEARRQVGIAQEALRDVESHDRLDDATAERLAFIRTMIDTVLHGVEVGQAISYERDQLIEEKRQLETYLEYAGDGDDPELVTDGGEPATSEQKTVNDRYEVPKDALTQRHQYCHVPGCHRAPDWSELVTARETYMRALKPCPECDPRRPDPA
jgi:hypothetical protein